MEAAVLVTFPSNPAVFTEVVSKLIDVSEAVPQTHFTIIGSVSDAQEDLWHERVSDNEHRNLVLVPVPGSSSAALWEREMESVPETADVVITLDAAVDNPGEIPRLLEALESGNAGVVAGAQSPSALKGPAGFFLRLLTDGSVTDPASTFRAYRAEVVRGADRSHGPRVSAEILADVWGSGALVAELPVARRLPSPESTASSRAAWQCLREQLFGRFSLIGLAAILLGIGLFLLLSWPAHQYAADSDAALTGICGTDVFEGRHRLFNPGGYRIGPQNCYLGAMFVAVLGPNRNVLSAVTLLNIAVFLPFLYFALRTALGSEPAAVGTLMAAFPPLQHIFFVEPPLGYGSLLAGCAIQLWFGFVMIFRPNLRSPLVSLLYGFGIGVNFWLLPQSLMLTGPLTLFVVISGGFRTVLDYLAAVAAVVAGLSAYVFTLASMGVAPFATSFPTQAVTTLDQWIANLKYLFSDVLPAYLLTEKFPLPSPMYGLRLILLVLAFLATCRIALPSRRNRATSGWRHSRTAFCAAFTIAVVVSVFVLYTTSGAGSIRGWTVRYLAPLFFCLPMMAALLYAAARRHSIGALTMVCVVILSVAHAAEYRLPGHPDRVASTEALAADHLSYDWLRQKRRNVVLGDYWQVYKLNFGFGHGIQAIPCPLFLDYLAIKDRVEGPSRVALLGRDPGALAAWAARAGLPGHVEAAAGGAFAFLVDGEIDPKRIASIAAFFA
ncbi:MAG: hypothetical protein SGI92_17720 [Bryobacteraceae bacterium]|nr:hypothetical protein [Bryobacteraceae bacterium]